MATTLVDPTTGSQITVPDDVVHSYLSRGWVSPGTPAPAEPPATEEADDELIELDE